MKKIALCVVMMIFLMGCNNTYDETANVQRIMINQVPLNVELAITFKQRANGLMYRTHLDAEGGMLFALKENTIPCFWMKNTYIPLTIAYLSETGVIIQLEDLKPLSEKMVCAKQPIRYALEVNQGWFQSRKIKLGDVVRGLPH